MQGAMNRTSTWRPIGGSALWGLCPGNGGRLLTSSPRSQPFNNHHQQTLLPPTTQPATLDCHPQELQQLHQHATTDLAATKAALAKSEEGRVRAEGRLPEIDVLQGQLTAAHEALSDARFRAEELRAAAAAKEQQVRGFGLCGLRVVVAVGGGLTRIADYGEGFGMYRMWCRHQPGRHRSRFSRSQASTTLDQTRPKLHLNHQSQLGTDKLALEQQVSSLQAASQRLERELAAAGAKAGQQEGQLAELYELCTSQQGARGCWLGLRSCVPVLCASVLCIPVL